MQTESAASPEANVSYLRSQKTYGIMTSITIRQETQHDHATVYELIREAFEKVEESDHGKLVGHILLTRIRIINDAQAFPSLAVAPLSVLPSWQRQGIGSASIREAHRRAAALGYGSAVLLGHPGYYPRFGYLPAHRFGIRFPFEAPADCCMAVELSPDGLKGVQGRVEYDPAFG